MQRVTFTLRTLTPLFLAGADQTSAELRAPTFRGLMRYWQRALVGGIVGTDAAGLKTVIEQEKSVFGATDSGSAVSIKVITTQHEETADFHREGTRWNNTGKDYLFWSMEKFGSGQRRQYFPQEISFQVELALRGNNVTPLKQAQAALWLLVHLGGIGSRSRRGGGSLTIQPVDQNSPELLLPALPFTEPATINVLQTYLKQGIDAARNLYNVSRVKVNHATFDTIAQDVCRIWILHNNGKAWNGADEALNAIGLSLQAYRKSITPLWKRKVFGLPLKNVSNARRPSPLLLSIKKLKEEQYVSVAVLFKTENGGIRPADYKLIEDWIDRFPGRLEVTL